MTTKSLFILALCAGLFAATVPVRAADVVQPLPKSPALDLARQLNQAFIEVAEKVSPVVVVIEVTQKATPRSTQDESFWEMLPPEWRRFFEEHGRGENEGRRIPRQTPQGRGSGIVLSEDGFILTNNHVVEDAEKITVRFRDGRQFTAKVQGADPQSDLAVIKIDAKGLTSARFGDSSAARVGEFVLAIGAPFNLDYSVTIGHISAKGRSGIIPDPMLDQDFIQTDASINPGNSGGPLVNLYGEVIGINSMIRGIGTGIGFAISSNLAKLISERLIKEGKFVRSRIGIVIRDLREYQEYKSQVPGLEDGVVVDQIMSDGPAGKSDLKAGDVVTAVDGKTVKTSRELKEQIAYKRPGDMVQLDVVRPSTGGKTKNLKIKVKTEAFPDSEVASTGKKGPGTAEESSNFGLTAKTLSQALADEFGIDETEGVIVTEVAQGSIAAEKGIKTGDVITEVNRAPVANVKQFREAMKAADTKKGVIINFVSKGTSRFTVLKED